MPALVWRGDLRALGRAELQRLGEAALAAMEVGAVDVGVVEEVDSGGQRGVEQGADLGVRLLLDSHHPGDDGGDGELGTGQGEGLHGCVPRIRRRVGRFRRR